MPDLAFKCAPHVGLIPIDEAGADYCAKNAGKLVQGKFSRPRSLDQNSLLWAVAERAHENLPEHLTARWPGKYEMVKGLQLRLGIVDEIATWNHRGWQITAVPKSIADMDHEQATDAVDKLLDGMAALLNVDRDTLLNEAAPWARR